MQPFALVSPHFSPLKSTIVMLDKRHSHIVWVKNLMQFVRELTSVWSLQFFCSCMQAYWSNQLLWVTVTVADIFEPCARHSANHFACIVSFNRHSPVREMPILQMEKQKFREVDQSHIIWKVTEPKPGQPFSSPCDTMFKRGHLWGWNGILLLFLQGWQ